MHVVVSQLCEIAFSLGHESLAIRTVYHESSMSKNTCATWELVFTKICSRIYLCDFAVTTIALLQLIFLC